MQDKNGNKGNFERGHQERQQQQQQQQQQQRQRTNKNGRSMREYQGETKQQRLQLELVPPPPARRQHQQQRQQQRQRVASLKAANYPTAPQTQTFATAPATITRNNTKNSFRGHMKYSQTIQSKATSNAYGSSSTKINSPNELFDGNLEKMRYQSDNQKPYQQFHTNKEGNSDSNDHHRHAHQQQQPTLGKASANGGNARQRQQHFGAGGSAATKKSSNANTIDNDELKDYKSKIKNKYNIDYDHSLDAEYEIIEAIE
uniref:Uncharacterized protein n=1 Tax=Stomoxys calcitrans TaxID=35570 RepID=A0A1I8PI15_STOCA